MKRGLVCLSVALLLLGTTTPVPAAEVKDKVDVQVQSVGLHPGMDPGMYVCALGHLHIKATVQNLADVQVGQVKVTGRALGVDGKLLGTATASTKQSTLAPNQKAEINLEFLTVTGPLIQQVKNHELIVVEAPIK